VYHLRPQVLNRLYVPRTEPRTLTAREAGQRIATARGDRLEALYTLALHTGARQGELLALRWADVDFAGGYLTIRGTLQRVPGRGFEIREPKTRRSIRRIALPPTVVEALRAHGARQDDERAARGSAWDGALALVFTNEVGRPIEPQNLIRRSFRPLLRRGGLPAVRFHDLRHTAASILLAHGEGPLVVAQRLGHASVTTTMGVYGHVQPGQDEHAAMTLEAAYTV
jgi:integrase